MSLEFRLGTDEGGEDIVAQVGLTNIGKLDPSLYPFEEREHPGRGIQLGLRNFASEYAGVQAGVSNVCEEALEGAQFGIFNEVKAMAGIQLGLRNEATDSCGVQMGAYNVAPRNFRGLQVGLLCLAADGRYAQLGLLTVRMDNPWYRRFSPLFGYSRYRDAWPK